MMEWISTKDMLPNENDRVIAFRKNESKNSTYRCTVMWGWAVLTSYKHRGITHWMLLPDEPKED